MVDRVSDVFLTAIILLIAEGFVIFLYWFGNQCSRKTQRVRKPREKWIQRGNCCSHKIV